MTPVPACGLHDTCAHVLGRMGAAQSDVMTTGFLTCFVGPPTPAHSVGSWIREQREVCSPSQEKQVPNSLKSKSSKTLGSTSQSPGSWRRGKAVIQRGSEEAAVAPALRQVGSALFATRADLTWTAVFRFLPRMLGRALPSVAQGWSLTWPGWRLQLAAGSRLCPWVQQSFLYRLPPCADPFPTLWSWGRGPLILLLRCFLRSASLYLSSPDAHA